MLKHIIKINENKKFLLSKKNTKQVSLENFMFLMLTNNNNNKINNNDNEKLPKTMMRHEEKTQKINRKKVKL